MRTPVTTTALRKYDHEDPLVAAALAWRVTGPVPHAHYQEQAVVRDAMPLLARALDRATHGRPLADRHYGQKA